MIPLCRAVAFTTAERGVRPRDNQTTRQHDCSPVASFRLVEISSSERGQPPAKSGLRPGGLPGSPASVGPPNNENRSAPERIRRGEQRITASRGAATISAFQHFSRSPTSDLRPLASAFTLIEMLVVTLIIAALATLTMTGASTVFDRARKTQAKNDETQIVTAVNAYYTEYGKYPMADARQGTDTLYGKSGTAPGNEDLFNVLRAISKNPDGTDTVDVNDTLNPRKIIFFSGKDGGARPRSAFATAATTDTQGNPINIGAFADPYGNAYMVAIDGSYDGATVDSLPYTDVTYATGNTVRIGCFAESFGKDGVQGRKQSNGTGDKKYSGSDDVLSWQ